MTTQQQPKMTAAEAAIILAWHKIATSKQGQQGKGLKG